MSLSSSHAFSSAHVLLSPYLSGLGRILLGMVCCRWTRAELLADDEELRLAWRRRERQARKWGAVRMSVGVVLCAIHLEVAVQGAWALIRQGLFMMAGLCLFLASQTAPGTVPREWLVRPLGTAPRRVAASVARRRPLTGHACVHGRCCCLSQALGPPGV